MLLFGESVLLSSYYWRYWYWQKCICEAMDERSYFFIGGNIHHYRNNLFSHGFTWPCCTLLQGRCFIKLCDNPNLFVLVVLNASYNFLDLPNSSHNSLWCLGDKVCKIETIASLTSVMFLLLVLSISDCRPMPIIVTGVTPQILGNSFNSCFWKLTIQCLSVSDKSFWNLEVIILKNPLVLLVTRYVYPKSVQIFRSS